MPSADARTGASLLFTTSVRVAALAFLSVSFGARAQDPPDFRGKTVTVIASFEAGGPYDFYSRLVARFLGAHLPGNAERDRAEHAGRRRPARRQLSLQRRAP